MTYLHVCINSARMSSFQSRGNTCPGWVSSTWGEIISITVPWLFIKRLILLLFLFYSSNILYTFFTNKFFLSNHLAFFPMRQDVSMRFKGFYIDISNRCGISIRAKNGIEILIKGLEIKIARHKALLKIYLLFCYSRSITFCFGV